MDLFLDCLLDAALDTLRLVPFLLVTYFALVALEYKAGAKTREVVARAGASGPAIGAMFGAVPQCGFSAAAAMLYAGRVITLGTLFAVFLSTSDEMLPLMIAQQADPGLMVQLVLLKVALGMVTGFLVDLAIRVLGIKVQGMGAEFVGSNEPEIFQLDSGSIIAIYPDGSATLDGDPFDLEALLAQANEEEGLSLEKIEEGAKGQLEGETNGHAASTATAMASNIEGPAADGADASAATTADNSGLDNSDSSGRPVSSPAPVFMGSCGPGCACGADMGWSGVVRETLVRSAEVTFFVLLVTLVLNLILGFAGEDALSSAISAVPGLSIFVSALVGLIPNCAASVAITQLYLAGVLSMGATMAGLLVSAGIGLLVLFSTNRSTKQNLAILAVLYVIGVAWGFVIDLLGIAF
ncbi:MAG: putative manganese transporter [Coriobacteriaceae bacterium]|nr:putative manganese transporter [Coriobacteriaceae bacterium]